MELPEVNARIKELVNEYALGSVRRFALDCGLYAQLINRLFLIDKRSGNYPSPSADVINAILHHSNIEYAWLVNGIEPKTKTTTAPEEVKDNTDTINLKLQRQKYRIEFLEEQLEKMNIEIKKAIEDASIWRYQYNALSEKIKAS